MSRGQLARTPANFPHMKHRAAGRIAQEQEQEAAFIEAMNALTSTLRGWQEVQEKFMTAVEGAIALVHNPPTQSDFALMPPPKYRPPTLMDRQELQQQFGPIPDLRLPHGHIG